MASRPPDAGQNQHNARLKTALGLQPPTTPLDHIHLAAPPAHPPVRRQLTHPTHTLASVDADTPSNHPVLPTPGH